MRWRKGREPIPKRPSPKAGVKIIFQTNDGVTLWYWEGSQLILDGDTFEILLPNCTSGQDDKGLYIRVGLSPSARWK